MLRQRNVSREPWAYIVGSFLLGVLVTYFLVSSPKSTSANRWDPGAQHSLRSQKLMLETSLPQVQEGKKKLLAIVGVQVLPVLSSWPAAPLPSFE